MTKTAVTIASQSLVFYSELKRAARICSTDGFAMVSTEAVVRW